MTRSSMYWLMSVRAACVVINAVPVVSLLTVLFVSVRLCPSRSQSVADNKLLCQWTLTPVSRATFPRSACLPAHSDWPLLTSPLYLSMTRCSGAGSCQVSRLAVLLSVFTWPRQRGVRWQPTSIETLLCPLECTDRRGQWLLVACEPAALMHRRTSSIASLQVTGQL